MTKAHGARTTAAPSALKTCSVSKRCRCHRASRPPGLRRTATARFVCITARRTTASRRLSRPRNASTGAGSRHLPRRARDAPQFKQRRGLRARCDARPRPAPRRCSGGVVGTMPWPRLKMCPGAGPAARTMRCALRAQPSRDRSAAPADRDCPAARRARRLARAPRRCRRSSRGPRTSRRIAAMSSQPRAAALA